ncbi:cytochrome b561 [Klebsiella pneumoniae]|uniref:cytochrome b561 n=1 Tax=Klebsiella pneumoniae TaxID=573 RepID=UPI0030CD6ADF
MRDKYSGLQIGIHWLVFLLVVVAYAAMELRGFFPRSERPLINMVHVSCGITIFVLMVARLLVRLKSPAPPIVPKPSPMMTGFAHLGHLAIYLLFIALPLIGMVMMYWRGNPWYAFGRHCCKVSDEAAFCLIQRPYISKTLLTRRISPRGSP